MEENAQMERILKPQTLSEHIAYAISQIGSPPVVGLLAVLLVAISLALPGIWLWTGVFLLAAVLAPVSFLVWQVRRGHVTDMEIYLREQRYASLLATVAGFAIAALTMYVGHAPQVLFSLSILGLVQWFMILLITQHWKISVHATSITGVSLFMWRVLGGAALPLIVSVPLVAWSRVKLRRHTPGQVLAGVLLGCAVFLVILWFMPPS